MIHLSTISPFTIHVGTTRLTAGSHRACAAMLYLVTERGKEIPRRMMADLFFPDSSKVAGEHALRQLVYRLRKKGVPLHGDTTTVMLAHDAATWDVEAVESSGQCSDKELEALSKGYLSAFSRTVSGAFAEWLDGHRSSVSTKLRHCLVAQLREERAKHRYVAVDRVARACLALDPFNEEATHATAEVLVMGGSKTEALSVLDRYIDEIGPRSSELSVAPKLLRERISEYVVDSGLLAEPPLVGRDTEMTTLRALLSRVGRGNAEACVLWGSSGIGKTRLLNEASSIAALEGLAVIRCALQPHDLRRPLAVLRDMAPRLLDLPGALGAAPESLALVRGLCGRGEMPARELPRTTQDSEVALAGVLASAIDLLDAVSSERPLLLCVEDAHWLDPASIELIIGAVAGQRPVCILMASQRTVPLPQSLADAARFSSIEVSRLSRDWSLLLMRRLFERSERTLDSDFVDWAIGLADGVPFYLHSLFIEYVTTGDRTTIPGTLTASLASKLERLGEPTRSVFDAIVVLGQRCTPGRLETLVQLPRHSLVSSLRELEERGLIRSAANMVSCTHELFAVTARGKMPASVAKMLHRATAEMLEGELGSGGAEPWDVATHWNESGDAPRGVDVMLRCAAEALRVGRPQEAIAILARVSTHPVAPSRNRQVIEVQLAAFEAAGEGPLAAECAGQLIGLLGDGDSEEVRRSLTVRRTEARLFGGGKKEESEGELRAIMLADDDEHTVFRSAMLSLTIAEDACNIDLAKEALAAVERVGRDRIAGMIPYMVYHVLFGSLELALETAEKLQAAFTTEGSTKLRHRAELSTAEVFFRVGKPESAIACFQRAYRTATEIGLRGGQVAAASQFAFAHWCLGDNAHFEEWYQTTSLAIEQATAPSHVGEHYSNGILRALDAGRTDDATELLAKGQLIAPQITEGRRHHVTMAYDLRIDLAKGKRSVRSQTDALLLAYRPSRGFGGQDLIVDTLISGLRRSGRGDEAEALRTDFLSKWRRDRYPIAAAFSDLRTSSH